MLDRKGFSVLAGCFLFAATAVAAMVINRDHVVGTCGDVRSFMDGGVYAKIERGGINPHVTVTVSIMRNLKLIEIGKTQVQIKKSTQKNGVVVEELVGDDIKMSINQDKKKAGKRGYFSQISSSVGDQLMAANLYCQYK